MAKYINTRRANGRIIFLFLKLITQNYNNNRMHTFFYICLMRLSKVAMFNVCFDSDYIKQLNIFIIILFVSALVRTINKPQYSIKRKELTLFQ